jgi:aspartate racemase
MKTLGLIGGMSWESTAVYYELLNRLARERLGGQHSAKLVLWSIDFAPMAALQSAGLWDEATAIMIDAARRLERAGAEAILICANTMHRMADEVAAAVGVPLLHVADALARDIAASGAKRPLLLATRYTMEQSFYRDRLRRGGVEVVIPPERDRARLHAIIFDELVRGKFKLASKEALVAIVERCRRTDGVDAVILGCTEFGLLVKPEDLPAPTFDTTELHAKAAIDFAFAD